jgi:hypothetical protein
MGACGGAKAKREDLNESSKGKKTKGPKSQFAAGDAEDADDVDEQEPMPLANPLPVEDCTSTLLMWGCGGYGRLGFGNEDSLGVPDAAVPLLAPVVQFSCGGQLLQLVLR